MTEDSDVPLLRVLWMLAHGMVWQWLMTGLCEQEAADRAVADQLVCPPVGEHLGYHLTDEGRKRLVDWYLGIAPRRGRENFAQQWRAVTYR